MTKDNDQTEKTRAPKAARHGLVALGLAAIVAGMVGLSFAAVPLYRIFCQQTGYAGTPQRASVAPDQVSDQTVNVRFDANTMPDMPWRFVPEKNEMTVRIGASNLAFFKATNLSDEPIVGTAVFNVAPNSAAQYFNKIQCFCFTQQRLEPGETIEMPVTFFIEPGFLDNVSTKHIQDITLSYTFYRDKGQGVAAAPAESGDKSGS
ncbi:Cytochrome c oxidase assembly protein CtaG [Methyloligella halotolerans]|uniref:Cytochrome c oxidase assembly protein CtaG n=1 Tax=Methyloligella halotolerans TaxID=1177755 RepID=A0A1E2RYK6_9HYPH|nr:cytochrome c oxidase assembly protein [Methyloligella halotolerans]ODA67232.1 Cytochrome c oxidase assembly protein CtaG [Methyloligella halotolerans]